MQCSRIEQGEGSGELGQEDYADDERIAEENNFQQWRKNFFELQTLNSKFSNLNLNFEFKVWTRLRWFFYEFKVWSLKSIL